MAVHEAACSSAPMGCAAVDVGCAWGGTQSEHAAHEAGCALLRLQQRLAATVSRFASERQLYAKLTVALAGKEVGRCKSNPDDTRVVASPVSNAQN